MVLMQGTSRLMRSKVSGPISQPVCLAMAGMWSMLLVLPPVAIMYRTTFSMLR